MNCNLGTGIYFWGATIFSGDYADFGVEWYRAIGTTIVIIQLFEYLLDNDYDLWNIYSSFV